MAGFTRTPRTRGLISGLFLFLLGAWGGLGPFVAPYFRYGYLPDRAWAYTSGRFYLSALPGAIALLAGLTIMITRNRGLGGVMAVIAALGGAWLIGGASLLSLLPARYAITAGQPLRPAAATLAQLGLFTGTGTLIVLFAGLALGRFSLTAVRDLIPIEDDYDYEDASGGYPPGPAPLVLSPVVGPLATTEQMTSAKPPG